jgi:hypothetical protein
VGEENLPSPFLRRADKAAVAKAAAVAAASSILNPSNVSPTCVPNPSSKGTQSTDSGPGIVVVIDGEEAREQWAVAEGC